MKYLLVLVALWLPALGSCGSKDSQKQYEGTRWFRGELISDVDPVVFQMSVDFPLKPASQVILANGDERVPWPMRCEEKRKGKTKCVVSMAVYGSSLELDFSSDSEFSGRWLRDPVFKKRALEVRAVAIPGPGVQHRYASEGKAIANISGDWVVTIETTSGPVAGKASFVQDSAGVVTESITPESIGDSRYLAGRMTGDTVFLSTFNGQLAYVVELTLSPDDRKFDGVWHMPDVFAKKMHGYHGAAPSVLAELKKARVTSRNRRVTIPGLEALRGKPVIVDLSGSWCPSCRDLTPVLVELYKKHSGEGLEVLSLAYEMTIEKEAAEERVRVFHESYGVPWESTVVLGEDINKLLPPEIETTGFPVTLFINRDGTVAQINTGFISPASPTDHKLMVAAFQEWTQGILKSVDGPDEVFDPLDAGVGDGGTSLSGGEGKAPKGTPFYAPKIP